MRKDPAFRQIVPTAESVRLRNQLLPAARAEAAADAIHSFGKWILGNPADAIAQLIKNMPRLFREGLPNLREKYRSGELDDWALASSRRAHVDYEIPAKGQTHIGFLGKSKPIVANSDMVGNYYRHLARQAGNGITNFGRNLYRKLTGRGSEAYEDYKRIGKGPLESIVTNSGLSRD